jgi:hypothetical protein
LYGHFEARYREIAQYTPEELVLANFTAIQALVAWEMDSNRTFEGEKRTLMAAIEVLIDQEQISAEYGQFVRMTLAGWSAERLTSIVTQAQSLPLTAKRLSEAGETDRQVEILQQFLIAVMSQVDDREARTLGMQCLTRLKLESGMSPADLRRMLRLIEAGDERRAAAEMEEETVEVDSSDVNEEDYSEEE